MNSNSQDSPGRSFSEASENLESATEVLDQAVPTGQDAVGRDLRSLGPVATERSLRQGIDQEPFLLGSISKPICIAALLSLYDDDRFRLDTPVHHFLPAFQGDGREQVTIQHLLTHVSVFHDQLPNNAELRRKPLATLRIHRLPPCVCR